MTTPTPDTPTPKSDAPTSPKAAMFIVFLVVFIDLLGFGIVLPLLPRYAKTYLGDMPEQAQGVALGLLYCVFSAMQFLFAPVWGRISDRIGRRPILLLGLAGSAVFYAMFAVASAMNVEHASLAIGLLFLSRLGAGIAGASVATAQAVIADVTTPEKRSHGMALIGAAFGIGFTFGPLIAYAGLEIFEGKHWAPGAVAAGLSFLALVLGYRLLPETRKPGRVAHAREWFSAHRTAEVLRMPTVGSLVLIYFMAIFAFANFEGTLSLFTESAFGLDDRDNFLVFAYVGFVLMVAQGGVYRRFAGKVPEEKLLNYGIGMMFLGLAGLAAVAWLAGQSQGTSGLQVGFFVALACAVFGFAFVNPSVSSLVSKRSDPTRQGEVLGVNQSFAALGRILGPFLGLILFKLEPSRTLPYLAAVLTLLVVVALLPRIRQIRKDSHG